MSDQADDDDGLSEYERRFVEAYMGAARGCGQHAVEAIGPSRGHAAATTAFNILKRPHVRRAMKAREEGDPLVGTRIERMRFYTAVMRGESKRGRSKPPTMRDRLEAAQTLSKICGDFLPPIEDAGDGKAAGMTLERLIALMTAGGMQQ